MPNLPTFESQAFTEVQPLNLSTPAESALSSLGGQIEGFGARLESQHTMQLKKAAEFQAGTDVASKSMELSTQAKTVSTNPVDQKDYYDNHMKSYINEYMQGTPDAIKPYTKQIAVNSYLQQQRGFNEQIVQQAKVNNQLNYYQLQDSNRSLLTNSINNDNYKAAQKTYQRIDTFAKQAGATGIISPIEAKNDIESAQKQMQSDAVLHKVDQLYTKDPDSAKAYISDMISKGIPGYSNDEVLTLASRAKSLMNLKKSSIAVDNLILNRNWKLAQQSALKNGTYNAAQINQYIEAHPDEEDGVKQTLNRNIYSHSLIQSVLSNPGNQQQELLDIKNNKGVDLLQFNDIKNGVISAQKEISNSPHDYFANNPAVEKSVLINQMVKNGIDQGEAEQKASNLVMSNPDSANLMVQRLYQIPSDKQQIINSNIADIYANQIKNANGQQKLALLTNLFDKYNKPDEQTILGNQLQKAGVKSNVLISYQALQNPLNSQYKDSIAEWLGSDPKEVAASIKNQSLAVDDQTMTASANNTLSDYIQGLNNYRDGSLETINKTINNVKSYAKYLLATGEYSDQDKAVTAAANALVLNNVNTASINGKTILLPKNINPDYIKIAFHTLTNDLEKQNIDIPRQKNALEGLIGVAMHPEDLLDPKEIENDYKSNLKYNAYFKPDGTRNGLYLVDGNGQPILAKQKNGKSIPVFFSYNQLTDPSSDVYKHIHKQDVVNYNIGIEESHYFDRAIAGVLF